MSRLMLAMSLAFLVGLFAMPGHATNAYGFTGSSDQAQLAAPGSYRAVAWHRYWSDDDSDRPIVREDRSVVRDSDGRIVSEDRRIVRDDRPVVRRYYYDHDPYYPYTYYYGPGLSVDVPFFHFHAF